MGDDVYKKARAKKGRGLKVERHFTKDGINVFDLFKYDIRSSVIRNPSGDAVFEMNDVEVPAAWSQVATDILAQKYFRKAGVPLADGSTGSEKSIKQVARRMANCWKEWGVRYGYFASAKDADIFYDEIVYTITGQLAAPNSPQWFNTGLYSSYNITGKPQGHYFVDPATEQLSKSTSAYERPQPHACFILSVEDDLVNEGGVMDLLIREARIFKYGSGVGTNFSKIRGENEKLSGGGYSSGLMSFLKIGDRAAGAIKSGGTTRRAAKMVCLDLDHPEIENFVNWKVEEEKKVAALIAAGYSSDYEGEAYRTVSGQNSNNSVRIPNSFFKALKNGGNWDLTSRMNGKTVKTVPAQKLWDDIAFAAWACADPGVQFDSTINEWHTCPEGGRINASNPCVTADTFVTTHKGLERISDIIGQSRGIKSFDNKMHWVESIFSTGNQPVYQLKTKSGYTLKLTANHKVYTLNRGDIPASELSKDDRVRLVKGEFGTESTGGENIAQLIGLLVGDGCVTNLNENDSTGNQRRVAFLNMNRSEKAILDWANDQINELRPAYSGHNKRGNVVEAGTTLRVCAGSPKMLSMFEQVAVLDKGSENKQFKDTVFTFNKSEQAAIIRGLFTADGRVANYGEKSQFVSLDSVSLELLRQVQLMLLNFGIKAKIYENRRAGKLSSLLPDGKGNYKEYPVKEIHSLRISKSSGIGFEKEIGFMPQSNKAIQLKDLNSKVTAYNEDLSDYVATLDFIGNEDVFDLSEPETSHFVANGIAVHNCSEYMFLDNTACNLASINLAHFFDKNTRVFDVKGFEHTCRIWTIVLEISVLMAQFPSKEVAQLSYDYRTLGLGYANLGSALMVNGIPYDSKKARAIAAAITAIMTGTAYATSAEMAKELGPFSRFEENKQHMLRVMRNHRYAAYNSTDNFDGLEIHPPGIDQMQCPDYLLSAACNAWDKAVEMGEKYGYRNAQTTVIAPTGTIGLVMDCDTTGIEPDFALVKFKKLSGGGYFKIINQAVPEALSNLGYAEHEVTTIINYAKGAATLKGAPFINFDSLKAKGLTDDELEKLDKGIVSAFEIGFAFNIWTMGEECLKRLGFTPEQYNAPDFNVLRGLGFTNKQIAEANEYICGTMTLEGAPYLKKEHYPIFDCANKCGAKGERYIHSHGHIKMMASAQPFLSGAISKTINLPNEAKVDEIKDCYELSWRLGLKANALYRDGCKLSQPLSTKSDVKEEKSDEKLETVEEVLGEAANVKLSDLSPEQVIEAAIAIMEKSKDTNFMRQLSRVVQKKSLPAKRYGYTQRASIDGQVVYVRTGEYEDGTLGEIFVDMHKEGATFRSLMNCFAIAVSVGLQYGVPLEEYVEKFTFTRFEPAGMVVGHANIKSATSIIDYIFRMLGYEYQDRTDLVHVITEQKGITGNPQMKNDDFNPDESNVYQPVGKPVAVDSSSSSKKQFSFDLSMGVQSDAPACNTCGHTTVRSGTCYKCLNCGNSMGCS